MAPVARQLMLLGSKSSLFRPKPGTLYSRSGFAAAAVVILTLIPARAQEPAPVCHARSVNVQLANKTHVGITDTAGASLCLYRGPTTVDLEVHQTSIAAILSALAGAYQVSYRSSIPLAELRSGKYAGPLTSVLSGVLDGYDYAIRHENSNIEVIIFDKSGGQPIPPPAVIQTDHTPAVTAEANQIAAVKTEAPQTRGEVTVSRTH